MRLSRMLSLWKRCFNVCGVEMAQLSQDAFVFGHDILSVEQALEAIRARVTAIADIENVPLQAADNRVLAQDVLAPIPLPPFANSAVDGYAVRFADLNANGETRLPVKGRVIAGVTGQGDASPCAIRIFTGAPMPDDFDTVFMQEDVRRDGDIAVLPAGLKKGANARPAGEDVALGAIAVPEGSVLRPQDIALLAALGVTTVDVRRRLRVAIFSTGNELTEAGVPLPPAGIYDSNRALLQLLCRKAGADVTDLGILPDQRAAIAAALAQANDHDLILTSGGVSTGEEDHVKGAVEDVGALTFWRIGIKPGRPVAMGVIGRAAFVGLPGNPVAVFVTFSAIVRPLMAAMTGALYHAPLPLPVIADFAYRKKPGRREFVRVSLAQNAAGEVVAKKHPRDGAGVLSSLTETDGLVVLPEAAESLAPGETIGFLSYAALL
jgi:molybdopterin molybdotransferase